MKKSLNYTYKLIFVLSYCLIVTTAFAQTSNSDLQQQFTAYQVNNYNEKIFVHTDKTFYIAGESIWFKIYCVDENFHKPSTISKIAYVEILSHENKPVLQAKIVLNEGSGNGSFIVPSYISSGSYTLRAYTKWMENFDAGYFFQTSISIINTLKTVTGQNEKAGKKYDLSFFPEGGNMVEGFTSKVAFKVVDEYGQPVECSGIVSDETNNTVASFKSLKFGMGNFSLTPKSNSTYKATIKLTDTTIVKQLPSAYKQGFVMTAENADDAHIKITASANTTDNTIYLLVQSQDVLKDFQQGKISNGESVFIIDKNKLADGISTITLFNSNKQPVCERLYFKKPVSILNIQSQADKNLYALRKPVNISLVATTAVNTPAIANMSAAVFMIDSLQSSNYNDIVSYLLLSAELKGNIISPAYYFQPDNKDADEAADNLMLTQGWRRFKWEDVFQNNKPYFQFTSEYEGLIINGKITGRYNTAPAKNISTTLTVPGENFQLAGAVSDSSGNLLFNIKNFYGSNNVIIQADSNYKTELYSSYSDNFSLPASPAFNLPLQWKDQLLYRGINVQTENAYQVDKKQRSYIYTSEDTSLFYVTPFKRYYLDDYTRFTTMEEVMHEYVTEVRVRKKGQLYNYKVVDVGTKKFSDNDPLILLDGVPVSNPNNIIEFDPLKIKRLDIISGKYYYGNVISDGIVSYTTYKGDLAGFTLNADNVVIKYDGLQREREFYSPVYDSALQQEKHLPDERNVLYWNPNLKTDSEGKANFNFYTSDVAGKFACIIQGITQDGIMGSKLIFLNVSP